MNLLRSMGAWAVVLIPTALWVQPAFGWAMYVAIWIVVFPLMVAVADLGAHGRRT